MEVIAQPGQLGKLGLHFDKARHELGALLNNRQIQCGFDNFQGVGNARIVAVTLQFIQRNVFRIFRGKHRTGLAHGLAHVAAAARIDFFGKLFARLSGRFQILPGAGHQYALKIQHLCGIVQPQVADGLIQRDKVFRKDLQLIVQFLQVLVGAEGDDDHHHQQDEDDPQNLKTDGSPHIVAE